MKIYGFPTFNVSKVLLTAEQIGVDYEYVALEPGKGEHKAPQHIQRHPLGKVPALEHDGHTYFESAAICRYLARVNDSPLYQGDAVRLAQVDQWLELLVHHLGRWMGVYFWEDVIKPGLMGEAADESALLEARGFLDQNLPVLEAQLNKHANICGNGVTIADTIGAAYVQISEVSSLDLGDYPAVCAWYGALRGSPAYARAMRHFPGQQIFSAASPG